MGSATPTPGRNNGPVNLEMNLNPTFSSQFALGLQFMPESVKGFFAISKILAESFLAIVSLPLEVSLRWRWGCRSMGPFQVCCLWWMALPAIHTGQLLLSLFLVGAAGLGAWHWFEARRWETRNPIGPLWRMTYSFGEPRVWEAIAKRLTRPGPRPRWLSHWAIFRFLEPATGLALGALLFASPFTRLLGFLLLLSGVALLGKRHLIYMRHVEETRDRRDAVAVGEMLSAEADTARRPSDLQDVFEVRLAVAAPLPEIPLPVVPVPAPPLASPAPSMAAGRVIRGPDESSRVVVGCPHCHRKIRCLSKEAESGVKCPNCSERFGFVLPREEVS